MKSRSTAMGAISVNVVTGANHRILDEVVLWQPNSPEARSLDMIVRWEIKSPANIDLGQGLVMFDSRRLWDKFPSKRPPKGLTAELRANRQGPWEGRGAIRGDIPLQYGVRLAADWADVRAMAAGREKLFLVTKSKGTVVDIVDLKRSDFELPEAEIRAFLGEVRTQATGPDEPCDPSVDIVT
jgi:hypothetical protein